MNWPFTVGRVLLVVLFVFSGVQKLLDVPGTAEEIAKVGTTIAFPAAVSDAAGQVADAVKMSVPEILAICVGVVEVAAGLLIAFNILTRTAAVILLIFTAVATFYAHDFWNMTGPDRANNMIHALKNLSIMGAFLMLAAWPRRRVVVEEADHERVGHDRVEPL